MLFSQTVPKSLGSVSLAASGSVHVGRRTLPLYLALSIARDQAAWIAASIEIFFKLRHYPLVVQLLQLSKYVRHQIAQ
ncbi:hypothetical protein HYPP_03804 [Hyphomicrobium sp. ghe19]|nr:hypothetical protein HYPP_03804 [Hyphomicrobium sp. ghe19]